MVEISNITQNLNVKLTQNNGFEFMLDKTRSNPVDLLRKRSNSMSYLNHRIVRYVQFEWLNKLFYYLGLLYPTLLIDLN